MVKRKKGVERSSVKRTKPSLSGVILDLQLEIKNLSKERSGMKKSLMDVTSSIEVDHDLENELRQKIANLVEKEAKLLKKKKKLEVDFDSASDKLNKISKISSEMKDI